MPLPALLAPLLAAGALAGGGAALSRGLKGRGAGAEFLAGSPGKFGTYDLYTPEQKEALRSILGAGMSGLANLSSVDFEPIAQQARQGFQQNTIPSIAERFTAMGAGAQQSSAFPQILGQAGAQLESNLAANKAQFGLQQQDQQQKLIALLLGLGSQPQFASYYQPSQGGLLQSLSSVLPLLGRGV